MTILVPSTTYRFTRTREQLRNRVLSKLRVLDPGEAPTAEDSATVMEAMDLRLKEMHQLGVLWWRVSGATSDLSLTSGSATVTVTADGFLFPVSLQLRVGTDDQDIEIISHRQYQAIPNKADTGEPEQAFFDGTTAYFWPVPNSDYTAKLTYQTTGADTATGVAPDVEVGAMRAFVVIVASDLIDDFQVQEDHARRILSEAQEAWRTIRALNSPRVDSTPVEITSY